MRLNPVPDRQTIILRFDTVLRFFKMALLQPCAMPVAYTGAQSLHRRFSETREERQLSGKDIFLRVSLT